MKYYNKGERYIKEEDYYIYSDDGLIHDIVTTREGQNVLVKITKRHYKKGEFFLATFKLDKLILENEYSHLEMKVVLALRQRLRYGNEIELFTQQELAEELKTSQANVSRALKRLRDDKIILKIDKYLFFNPEYLIYSGAEELKKQEEKKIKEQRLKEALEIKNKKELKHDENAPTHTRNPGGYSYGTRDKREGNTRSNSDGKNAEGGPF